MRRRHSTGNPAGSAPEPIARFGPSNMSGTGATWVWDNATGNAAYDLAPALSTLPTLIPANSAYFGVPYISNIEISGAVTKMGLYGGPRAAFGTPSSGISAGVLNGYLSTPDHADNSPTSDLDIRVVGSMITGIPATVQTYIAKWGFAEKSFSFRQLPVTGNIDLTITTDGLDGTAKSYESTAAPTTGQAVRVLFDGDNGANSIATFYTSDNGGSTWDQLGASVTDTQGDIFDSTNALEIGAVNGGTVLPMTGSVVSIETYHLGVQKTSMKAEDYVSGSTFTSADTGEVWTINDDVVINNINKDVVYSPGYVTIQPSVGYTVNSPLTVLVVAKVLGTPTEDNYIFATKSETTEYGALFTDFTDSDKWTISQDKGTISTLATFDNNWHLFTLEFNGDATTKLTVSGVGNVTADVGSDDFDFISLMSDEEGNNNMVGMIGRLEVYSTSLTAPQLATIQSTIETEFGL